jgi:hypothetical protein
MKTVTFSMSENQQSVQAVFNTLQEVIGQVVVIRNNTMYDGVFLSSSIYAIQHQVSSFWWNIVFLDVFKSSSVSMQCTSSTSSNSNNNSNNNNGVNGKNSVSVIVAQQVSAVPLNGYFEIGRVMRNTNNNTETVIYTNPLSVSSSPATIAAAIGTQLFSDANAVKVSVNHVLSQSKISWLVTFVGMGVGGNIPSLITRMTNIVGMNPYSTVIETQPGAQATGVVILSSIPITTASSASTTSSSTSTGLHSQSETQSQISVPVDSDSITVANKIQSMLEGSITNVRVAQHDPLYNGAVNWTITYTLLPHSGPIQRGSSSSSSDDAGGVLLYVSDTALLHGATAKLHLSTKGTSPLTGSFMLSLYRPPSSSSNADVPMIIPGKRSDAMVESSEAITVSTQTTAAAFALLLSTLNATIFANCSVERIVTLDGSAVEWIIHRIAVPLQSMWGKQKYPSSDSTPEEFTGQSADVQLYPVMGSLQGSGVGLISEVLFTGVYGLSGQFKLSLSVSTAPQMVGAENTFTFTTAALSPLSTESDVINAILKLK